MKIAKLLASAALSLGLVGFAGQAEAAGMSVIIDCHGDNGLPTWAETSNTVTIQVYVNGIANTIWSGSVSNATCNVENGIVANWGAFNISMVQKVAVWINGFDTFWMDKIKLKDADTGRTITWGVDNNQGFCLSHDPGDGRSSYCHQTVALPGWTFTP